MDDHSYELCPRCFIGHTSVTKATYITIFNGHLMTIPNLSARICDVCRYREFDDKSLAWVDQFILVDSDMADAPFAFKQTHTDSEEMIKPKTREP